MIDETQTNPPANAIFPPIVETKPEPFKAETFKSDPKTPDVPKVDHLVEIETLARSLHNASPSGAQTISDKILEHVGAIRDPKAHDERVAAEAKTEAEAEAVRKKVRDERKAKEQPVA